MELPQSKSDPQDYRAEVVLSDGRFARIHRHMTAQDVVMSVNPQGNNIMSVLVIASRICTIDEKPVEFKDLIEMEWLYVAPIAQMVNSYLLKMGPFLKGIG
jgi:hypothetical protein